MIQACDVQLWPVSMPSFCNALSSHAGFRKYDSIRATLVHELTHNVYGGHGNDFRTLCSQLNREVEQVCDLQLFRQVACVWCLPFSPLAPHMLAHMLAPHTPA
jgi:hypothetical protein